MYVQSLTQITVKYVCYELTQCHPLQHPQTESQPRGAVGARAAGRQIVARAVCAWGRSDPLSIANQLSWIDLRRSLPRQFSVGRHANGVKSYASHRTSMSREITFAELSQHNTENDLWLLIDGKGTLKKKN